MATTDTKKGYVAQLVTSPANKQVVRKKITDYLTSSFQSTLAREEDIVNLIMSLVQRESSFDPSAIGIRYSQSHTDKVLKYSAIKKVYDAGTSLQRANIRDAIRAHGLGQVTGYYILKGAGPNGVAELSRLRSDLADSLIIEPGEDVTTKLIGEENIDNQILATLIVLEGKYKSSYVSKLVSSGIFRSKLHAAIGAYLGSIDAADGLGTTPERYVNSIIGGANYAAANNGISPNGTLLVSGAGSVGQNNSSSGGPSKTTASGDKLSTPGC